MACVGGSCFGEKKGRMEKKEGLRAKEGMGVGSRAEGQGVYLVVRGVGRGGARGPAVVLRGRRVPC